MRYIEFHDLQKKSVFLLGGGVNVKCYICEGIRPILSEIKLDLIKIEALCLLLVCAEFR